MSLLISYKSINQKYFSSLIKIKTRKIWNKEILSNSNIVCVTMPLAFSQLPKHLVGLWIRKASEQGFFFPFYEENRDALLFVLALQFSARIGRTMYHPCPWDLS